MARNKGIAAFSANFEPQVAAPLDARYVVETQADLISTSTWQAHDGEVYVYNGMLVTVTNDANSSNNGLYYLNNAAQYTQLSSWTKVGESGATPTTYFDNTTNIIQNGSFLDGNNNWNVIGDAIISIIDAYGTPVQSRSGKAATVTIPSGTISGIETECILLPNRNYQDIAVQFSIYNHGEGTTNIQLVDEFDTIYMTQTVTIDTPFEYLIYANINGLTGKLYFRVTQEATFSDGHFTIYDIRIQPHIINVEKYSNSQPAIVGAAGIPAGSTFNEMTFTQFMEAFFYPELFGTLTPPSHIFNASVSNGAFFEIGQTIPTINFTSTFNRGSIDPQYMSDSPYRSGLPNTYYYTGTGLPASVSSTNLTDNQQITNYIILSGTQSWTSYIAYDGGVQPKGSKGTPFDSPLPAGNTSVKTISIIGVYPWFGTSVNITTLTKQPLALHTATYYQITVVGETDTDKQTVDFPVAFNAITGVQFYNTISGQWEWLGGSKANSLLLWTITDVQHDVQGTMVNYKRYTHNGVKVGSRQLRFYTN